MTFIQVRTGPARWRGLQVAPVTFDPMLEDIWQPLYGCPYATIEG